MNLAKRRHPTDVALADMITARKPPANHARLKCVLPIDPGTALYARTGIVVAERLVPPTSYHVLLTNRLLAHDTSEVMVEAKKFAFVLNALNQLGTPKHATAAMRRARVRDARPTPVGGISGVPSARGLSTLGTNAAINIPLVLRAEALTADGASKYECFRKVPTAQLALHGAAKANDSVLETGFPAAGAKTGIGRVGSVGTGCLVCITSRQATVRATPTVF
jgi:hypothetical protein